MKNTFEIYIDYDVQPALGGQQAVYLMDKNLPTQGLLDHKIVGIRFNTAEENIGIGHHGRVMILTLEKPN